LDSVAGMGKIGRNIIFLSIVWIILLLTIFSFLTDLLAIFNSNLEGGTIVSLCWTGYIISQGYNTEFGVTNIEANSTLSSGKWIGDRPTINNQISKMRDF